MASLIIRPVRSARARIRFVAIVLLVAVLNLSIAPGAYAASGFSRPTGQSKSSQKYAPAAVKKTKPVTFVGSLLKATEKITTDVTAVAKKFVDSVATGGKTIVDKTVQQFKKKSEPAPSPTVGVKKPASPAKKLVVTPPPQPAPKTVQRASKKGGGILAAVTRPARRAVQAFKDTAALASQTGKRAVQKVDAIGKKVINTGARAVQNFSRGSIASVKQAGRSAEKRISNVARRASSGVKKFFVGTARTVTQAPQKVYKSLTRTAQKIVPATRQVTEYIKKKVAESFTYPVQVTKKAYDTVTKPVREAYEIVKKVPRQITEWVKERVQETTRVARTVYDTVREWVTEKVARTVNRTRQVAETAWRTVTDWIPQTVRSGWGRFVRWFTQHVPVVRSVPHIVYRTIVEPVTEWVNRTREVVRQVPRIVYDTVTTWVERTKPVVKTVYDIIRETAYRTVMKPVQVARDVVETVWRTGTRFVEKVVPVVKQVAVMNTSALALGPVGMLTTDLRSDLAKGWDGFADSVGKFKDEMKEKYKNASKASTEMLMAKSPDWLKPVIGFSTEFSDSLVGVGLGVADFVGSAASGIVRTVIKPEDTIAGIGTAIGNLAKDAGQFAGELWNDPGGTIKKKAEGAWNGLVQWSKKDALDRGEDVGRSGAELASWAVGAGAARTAVKGAQWSNLARTATAVTRNNLDDAARFGARSALKVPQGLTKTQFNKISKLTRPAVQDIGEDIFVHGSRAAGTARAASDLDIGIRVSAKRFDELIQQSFKGAKPPSLNLPKGNAFWRTMQHAIKTGKIQRGEAGLRDIGLKLEKELGRDVDISVIRKGSPFDQGPYIELPK